MTPETRDAWLIALLALIALAAVVQTSLLVAFALAARRGAQRLAVVEGELRDQLRVGLAQLQNVADEVTVVAQHAHRQVDRVEHLLELSTQGARKAVEVAGRALLPPLKLIALYKGVRRGIDIYRARRA